MNYNYIDVVEHDGDMIVWTRDENGQLAIDNLPANEFYYLFMPDNTGKGEYQDLWKNPMKKVMFENKFEMKAFATSREDICESDVQPAYKAIHDLFHDCPDDIPLNVGLYDIEVDFDLADGKGYPSPENPYGEVNFISLFDRVKDKYVMLMPSRYKGVIDLTDDECPVEMIWHDDELELFINFKEAIEHIDVFTAWNGNGFDLPYMMARAFKIMAKADAVKWFCRDGVPARKREYINEYKQEAVSWTLYGRHHIDMMELYKKFVPGEKPSFSLDAVCEIEEVGKKIQYDDEGDLGELLKVNPQKFAEYSLHDSRLLKRLDDKLKIMDLALFMSRTTSVRITDITGSIKPLEHGFIKFCRKNGNIVLPDKIPHEKQKFDGAVVFDTVVGRHKWVFGIDLTSEYPHVMMMLGMSPETMIFQCEGRYDDFVSVMSNDDSGGSISVRDIATDEIYEILPSEMESIIREEGYVISGNGTIFDGRMGMFAQYIHEGFVSRKNFKDKMKECTKIGDKKGEVMYDLYQKVSKIKINSAYGAVGNENFRLFSLDMAASVTITAQVVSKQQATAAHEAIEIMLSEGY